MGTFRIAKYFEISTGHRLSKHPEKCRFPHGHTRRVEVVLRSDRLDDADMVCDYAVLGEVVRGELEELDHAMILRAGDPAVDALAAFAERVVVLQDGDPTTEIIARHVFRKLEQAFRPAAMVRLPGRPPYRVPDGLVVERVKVWETSTTWAEYGEEW